MTTPALTAPSQPSSTLSLVRPPVPKFEGSAVEGTTTKITGTAPIVGDDNVVYSIDDRVRFVGEYRVVGVRFYVDPKTGDTIREHMLKPIELERTPFDPSDPTDNGIVRSRPVQP